MGQTTDGWYILIGQTQSYWACMGDMWLIKTDAEGYAEWNQTYGGSGSDSGLHIEQTTDGWYILTGHTESYGAGMRSVWLIKTDINGHMEWNQTYGGPKPDTGSNVKQTTDGGYILIGGTDGEDIWSGWDMWLIKTDAHNLIESEVPWGPIILPITVIVIVLVMGGVFVKRKR